MTTPELFIPYLQWHERAEVHSLQQLDLLVDHLTTEANADAPFTVDLHANPRTGLLIVLGREESHVEFYSADSRPPIVTCRGSWEDDELIVFYYRGHHSELPKRAWIPIEDDRETLRRYFLTGKRPENIRWHDR
jgi:hypothetical protein